MSTANESDAWITCGQFGRAHGIKGDIRLWVHNPQSKLLKPGQTMSLTAPKPHGIHTDVSPIPPQNHYQLKRVRKDAKGLIVNLEGVFSRQDAEALNHCLWVMQRKDFKGLAKDEFYFADLIGVTGILDDGRSIGEVQSFVEAGAGMILVFEGEFGEIMVPYVDAFVIRLDLSQKQIHIHSVPGLLEGGL